jgi:hypothetical protein
MLRRLVIVLFCLALPLQGVAAAFAANAACPDEAMMTEQLVAGELSVDDLHDCCNDVETIARTGKPCKTGQQCHVPAGSVVPDVPHVTHVPPAHAVADLGASAPPASVFAAPWRPPAPI